MSIKIPGAGGGGGGGSGDLSADGTGWPVTAAVTFSNNVTIANTKDLLAATAAGSDVGSAAAGFGVGYFDTSVETPLLGAATGNPTFADGADADPTKKLGFLLTGITTGTTRTVTWPDADVTIPTTIGDFLADGTVAMTGAILLDPAGSTTVPAISLAGSTTDGISITANTLNFITNGVALGSMDAAGLTLKYSGAHLNFASGSGGSLKGNGDGQIYGFRLKEETVAGTSFTQNKTNGVLSNRSATGEFTWTLVTAVAGYQIGFWDNNATYRHIVVPGASDQIIWIDGTVVSAATGSITSTARYQSFWLHAVDADTWIATDVQDRGTAFTVVA